MKRRTPSFHPILHTNTPSPKAVTHTKFRYFPQATSADVFFAGNFKGRLGSRYPFGSDPSHFEN